MVGQKSRSWGTPELCNALLDMKKRMGIINPMFFQSGPMDIITVTKAAEVASNAADTLGADDSIAVEERLSSAF